MEALAAFVVLGLAFPATARGQTKSLDDYRSVYETEVRKLDAEYDSIVDRSREVYSQQLSQLKDRSRQQGDLESVLVFSNELTRFSAEMTVPEEGGAQKNSTLAALRSSYRKHVAAADESRMRRQAALAQRYMVLLNSLKKRVMQQDDVDQALRLSSEIKRIDFIMADLETSLPEKKVADTVSPATPLRRLPLRLRRDLEIHYPFDRDEGAKVTNAAEKSFNGHIRGANWAEGAGNGVMDFGGDGDKIEVADCTKLDLTGGLTVAMWIRPHRLGCRQNPFEKAYGGEGTMTLEEDGRINYFYGTSGRNSDPYSSISLRQRIKVNEWSHVILVRDHKHDRLTWYKNGEKTIEGKPRWEKTAASKGPIRIGHGYAGSLDGEIDDFMVWSRPLSSLEIRELYRWCEGQERGASARGR